MIPTSAKADPTGRLLLSSALPGFGGETAFGAVEMAQLRREFPGEGIGEIVQMFQEEGRGFLQQIADSVDRLDADGIRRAAHALKGGCANFGARPLEALCHEIEMDARTGNFATAASLLEPLRTEYHRLEIALEQERQAEHRP